MRTTKTTTIVRLECDFCAAVHEVAEEHLQTADLPWLVVKVETVSGDEHEVEWLVCPTCMDVCKLEEPPTIWALVGSAKMEFVNSKAGGVETPTTSAANPLQTRRRTLLQVADPDGLLAQELRAGKTIIINQHPEPEAENYADDWPHTHEH